MTTTITGKNQVTLPAELARELGWKPGTRLEWTKTDDGALIARRMPTRAELAEQLAGRGRQFLKPGEDPVNELVQQRLGEDQEEQAQGFA